MIEVISSCIVKKEGSESKISVISRIPFKKLKSIWMKEEIKKWL
jgi:hypothetical protein